MYHYAFCDRFTESCNGELAKILEGVERQVGHRKRIAGYERAGVVSDISD